MSSLALGTVQFGLPYGVNNKNGKILDSEIINILQYAQSNGIDTLDTAAAYGESESILGNLIPPAGPFKLITKLSPNHTKPVRAELLDSLKRLKTNSIYGYLLHSFTSWKEHPEYIEALNTLRKEGLVKKIGISLYSPEELKQLIESNIKLDLIQVPYNMMDRRFEPHFKQLYENGTEIHIRSVFLQGLFFIHPEILHPQFVSVKDKIKTIQEYAKQLNVAVSTVCLAFVLQNPYISKIVIGIDSLQHLKENIESFTQGQQLLSQKTPLPDISCTDETILLPQNWKKT